VSLRRNQSESRMPEIGTSGLMSGVGKQGGARRQYLRPTSTLPSFFIFNGGPYVAATHLDGTYLAPPNLFSGATTTPAKPGETVVLYANGFGPTSAALVSGSSTQSGTLSPAPAITIGGLPATVQFAGLVAPGEFQFNVVIPANAPSGDNAIVATYNGAEASPASFITVQGSAAAPASITYYVAPNGNDSWSGTLPAPNAAQTDGPFATLHQARLFVESISKTGLTQINVQFRAGTYYLPATEMFAALDSGTAAMQIVYENYPGESPVISGGMRVTNWTNVSANTWKTTLPASAQYFENLFYNDVRRLRPRLGGYLGTYLRIVNPVYLNAPAPPAAPPNGACSAYIAGSGWECFDRFLYNPSDPIAGNWKNLAPPSGNPCGQPAGNSGLVGDIELLDFEKYDAPKFRISCVDTANHIVYLTAPAFFLAQSPTAYGFIATHRYLVENVQDALTQPGQWFLDRSSNPWTLTYLANPGENPNTDTVIVPQIAQVLVASNLAYVTFKGLTFEHDNYVLPAAKAFDFANFTNISPAVSFQNSQYITIDSDIVAHTSGAGLEFASCIDAQSPPWCVSNNLQAVTSHNVIQNSAFYDAGAMAVRIGIQALVADTDANLPQFTTVQNNVVEGWGRVFPSYWGITQGEGHDNLYTHNDVYDGYHPGIAVCICAGAMLVPDSHDNTISFNHVYNLDQGIMNDDGSIYLQTRDAQDAPAPTGNKVLNNVVHDVTDASIMDADGYGGDGIYVDTESAAVDVENNLVYRVSGNTMNFAGAPTRPNEPTIIKNNIFAFGRGSMINVSSPYQSGAVPATVQQVFAATNNLMYFDRNTSSTPTFYVQGGCTYSGGFAFTAWEEWNSNMYWRTDGAFATDTQAFHFQPEPATSNPCYFSQPSKYTFLTFAGWQKTGEDVQSVVQNPGFANPAYPADDYSLPKGSPGVGFVVFDPSQAGRTNPVIMPPAVPATFPTKSFNQATDD
ncbi:MAG: hypothetical protein ACLQU1_00485, partial [Bryobacteraceae bacterium]